MISHKWVYDGLDDIGCYWSINKLIPPFLGEDDYVWAEKFDLVSQSFTEEYRRFSYGDFKRLQEG